jgi:DNA topoisomerase-1
MRYLVIVESPSKCKKIEEILNENSDFHIYEVIASMGHITNLNSLDNIDISNNFHCKYELISSKKKHIDLMKKKIKEMDEVILACDNDREGTGICYSICEVFKLDPSKTKRIIFNEITKSAILDAIKNPQIIDMNMVEAQKTRQILDILVGFKISPALWKYISKNSENALSAGRCQTPALKIIYDNYLNIKSTNEMKIYNIFGNFTNSNLLFELNHSFEKEENVKLFLNECINHSFIFSLNEPVKKNKRQPEPFITSKIQQIASNEFHYSPKETMSICQKLYESGFITYMRTDSKKYSKDFIDDVKKYILSNYETKYINPNIEELINVIYEKKDSEVNEREKICMSNMHVEFFILTYMHVKYAY